MLIKQMLLNSIHNLKLIDTKFIFNKLIDWLIDKF